MLLRGNAGDPAQRDEWLRKLPGRIDRRRRHPYAALSVFPTRQRSVATSDVAAPEKLPE